MGKRFFIEKFNKVHFVGIGGISTSSLARYCMSKKIEVSGSDKKRGEEVVLLKSLGAEVYVGHRKKLPESVDAVVYTSAVSADNAEIRAAKNLGIPIYKRSEFLGEIVKDFSTSVSVCGSHGKTTTTAILAEIFIDANLSPTVFLGGEGNLFGNFYSGGCDTVILEACEYKKNFLDISSSYVIVTNIDNDHLDSYKDVQEEILTFNEFIKNSVAFINADDNNSQYLHTFTAITYGIKNNACYTAKNIREEKGSTHFTVYAYGRRIGRIKLPLKGEYNVYNALSCVAFSMEKKIPFLTIKKSIEKFGGVKRRNEYIGEYKGVEWYADYAHHPTEIKSLLSAVDFDKTLFVFQPHTYSRTEFLMVDFIKVLSSVQNLVVYKTYPAREEYKREGSAKTLYKEIRKINGRIKYCERFEDVVAEMEKIRGIQRVYLVGAGDLCEIAKRKIKVGVDKNNLKMGEKRLQKFSQ